MSTPVLVSKADLKLLEPYLLGEAARENGEWDMYCPLHEDSNRSATLNVQEAIWFCAAGCGGGHVGQLIAKQDEWIPANSDARGKLNGHVRNTASGSAELPSEGHIAGWTEALLDNTDGSLGVIKAKRGLHEAIIKEYELGYEMRTHAYTIPVRNRAGDLVNLRRYQPEPASGRRKMWGIAGHNGPRLYPAHALKGSKTIVICEGELDCLTTIQAGYAAVTRTASASTWSSAWSRLFKGYHVYLCHDADTAGQAANLKVGAAVAKYAKAVKIIHLPYGIQEKHGKDLSDFWLEYGMDEFEEMLKRAVPLDDPRLNAEVLPTDARVIDALDSKRARKPLRLTVTVEAKAQPGHTVPRTVALNCNMDAGPVCEACPLMEKKGDDTWQPEMDDSVLEMMEVSKEQLQTFLRNSYGVKCKKFVTIRVTEEQAVETLFVRPSVDHTSTEDADYTGLRVRHVGGHDAPTNETVQLLGALYPSPKSQQNEFIAWEANPMETSIDRFDLDEETIATLKLFRPVGNASPLKKLRFIARELEANVTHIYGRTEMHMAMDLTWHAGLAFEFDKQKMERGWLELLVVGDTRTGKSEAARLLARHLGAGEVVSCETASLPGILGAVQQLQGQQWAITWGKIPLNDRRCVVLDEVDGLHPQEIAELSHLRSSGIAEINKVRHGRTHARTRLIWLGNPREGKMADFTFGIESLEPLIGKPEDIARFDLVMTVAAGEVESTVMNRRTSEVKNPRYTTEACNTLLRWAWSRKSENIRWQPEAEEVCFAEAEKMGTRYVENPPLVQAANVRIKIARVAVALALRTFSTDSTYENCIVTAQHVLSAVEFMDSLFQMPGFGYGQRSKNESRKREVAVDSYDHALEFMHEKPMLAVFLRDSPHFKPVDLEGIMNVERSEAAYTVSKLFEMSMVESRSGKLYPTPELREILRGIK